MTSTSIQGAYKTLKKRWANCKSVGGNYVEK